MAIKTPGFKELIVRKVVGGKRPLWHARHPDYQGYGNTICGAGNTADNAIADWQKQFRARMARDARALSVVNPSVAARVGMIFQKVADATAKGLDRKE
jgi:hypothetical protein